MRNVLLAFTGVAVACFSVQALCADPAPLDGIRGFDPQIGSWHTHVRRLLKPLSGDITWAVYEGTTVTRPLLDGRANIAELKIAGPAGKIEGVSLRLYEPDTDRWTMNFANMANGRLTAPIWGRVRDGASTFEGDDTLGDKPIRVRFVVTRQGRDAFRFEQSFSADAGRTWELNWIAEDRRIGVQAESVLGDSVRVAEDVALHVVQSGPRDSSEARDPRPGVLGHHRAADSLISNTR